MKLVGKHILSNFIKKHKDASAWINNWKSDVENAKWEGPQDIKLRYRSASFLADRVVIFNVKGNTYRLEIQVSYKSEIVFVKWAGTHAEYDKRY